MGPGQSVAGMLGLMVALLGACGGSDDRPQPQSRDMEPASEECTPGGDCVCDLVWPGTYVCDASGLKVCECEACQELPVVKAPIVQGCSGYPFGTWQLKHVDVEAAPLELTVDGRSLGQCPVTFTVADEPARVTMTLYESGVAEYQSEPLPVKMSYYESCVVNQVPAFGCGSASWTGVSNCELACNVCTCDSSTGTRHSADGMWTRTEQALSLNLFGDGSVDYAYCMTDNELELSAPGAYLVYARINKLAKPVPCSARSAAECVTSETDTCTLGGCVGDASCAAAGNEEACLASTGCLWDDAACSGTAPAECQLADYGVVPGCGLKSECRGTPEPCEDRPLSCRAGCTTLLDEHCSGGPLKCVSYSFCPAECLKQLGEFPCQTGELYCEGRTRKECEDSAYQYNLEPCRWNQVTLCGGTPQPCDSVSLEECNSIPGCSLVTTP